MEGLISVQGDEDRDWSNVEVTLANGQTIPIRDVGKEPVRFSPDNRPPLSIGGVSIWVIIGEQGNDTHEPV